MLSDSVFKMLQKGKVFFFFIHMYIQCLGHFSPLPPGGFLQGLAVLQSPGNSLEV
jgi:hypothetical protein